MQNKLWKYKLCSFLLIFTLLFSTVGQSGIVYAEDEKIELGDAVETLEIEELPVEIGSDIFEGIEEEQLNDSETTEDFSVSEEKDTDEADMEVDITTEEVMDVNKAENLEPEIEEETQEEVQETSEKEEHFNDISDIVEVNSNDDVDALVSAETEITEFDEIKKEIETFENIENFKNENYEFLTDEADTAPEDVNKVEELNTEASVKEEEKEIWRKIQDGDFFIELKEAILDEAGNILGWVKGLIGDDDGEYNAENDWISNLTINDGYFPIEGNDDGSGSWNASFSPDADGISYYKVTESKKYQEREILVDGSEGDLQYWVDETKKNKTPVETEFPVLLDRVDGLTEEGLPGVIYDETIYYLKYEDGELVNIKIVLKGENDPFSDIKEYSSQEIKEYSDRIVELDDESYPIDYFIKHLEDIGVKAVEKTEDIFNSLSTHDGKLNFNNKFERPKGEVEIDGNKNLSGKDLEDGEFEFVIKDAEENIVGTGTNNRDGEIVFDKIVVNDEGKFVYTIEEVNGSNSSIIYDDVVYKAVIQVRFDRLTNTLVTKLVYLDSQGNELDINKLPEFNNKYTPPTKPPVEPPTDPPTDPPIEPPVTPPTPPTPEEPPLVPPAPEIPEIPEISETPEEQEVPEAPETPEEPKVPQLPQTGIAGMTMFTTSGISLLFAGVWILRKKNK